MPDPVERFILLYAKQFGGRIFNLISISPAEYKTVLEEP